MVRIVHYYRDLTRSSGVTVAIRGWQNGLHEAGVETIALHSGLDSEWTLPSQSVPHLGKSRKFSIPKLSRYLRTGDILVLHEGWVASNLAAGFQAKRLGVPYVVVPHGVYEPQILKHLKFPYFLRRFFEKILVKNAAATHVFYETESQFARSLAPQVETFVLPTGLVASNAKWIGGGGYLAWFGRYSVEHKGLDRLLASYALVPESQRLPLRLRGIDYKGGLKLTENLVGSLGLSDWISVGGPIDEAEKTQFLRDCEGFIFPSRWESQGIALLEALAMGVPTLVSDSIHIAQSLMVNGVGTVTDFGDYLQAAQEISKFPIEGFDRADSQIYVEKTLGWRTIIPEYRTIVDKFHHA